MPVVDGDMRSMHPQCTTLPSSSPAWEVAVILLSVAAGSADCTPLCIPDISQPEVIITLMSMMVSVQQQTCVS